MAKRTLSRGLKRPRRQCKELCWIMVWNLQREGQHDLHRLVWIRLDVVLVEVYLNISRLPIGYQPSQDYLSIAFASRSRDQLRQASRSRILSFLGDGDKWDKGIRCGKTNQILVSNTLEIPREVKITSSFDGKRLDNCRENWTFSPIN